MNENQILSKETAKQFIIHYHGLQSSSKKTLNIKTEIIDVFNRIQTIQYDPLDVVGRNADLVIQSRVHGYRRSHLSELLYEDKMLLDNWDKMMCIIKTNDWPHLSRVRADMVKQVKSTMRYRGHSEALDILEDVFDYVNHNGPTRTKDMNMGKAEKGPWGHGKLSSVALDYLFHEGRLCVCGKDQAIKSFEVAEKWLSNDLFSAQDPFESDQSFFEWYALRRIKSMGFMWNKNGGGWLGHGLYKAPIRKKAIEGLLEKELITTFFIEGVKEAFYMSTADWHQLHSLSRVKKSMRFLAPLDNIMWDRDMIETLFDFNYRWEVYTPEAKRQYGYYVLPVIYGNEFVARFEPLHHRLNGPLVIKNWWWEKNCQVTSAMLKEKDVALKGFCAYLGADGYTIQNETVAK